jgi:hypothetical protein
MDARQIQLLCSCCPAVEKLALALCADAPPTACQHLLQLSGLTALKLHGMSALAPATIDVVAQLTGLKQLCLTGLAAVKDPTLLQLTARTALKELIPHTEGLCEQDDTPYHHPDFTWFKSKVRIAKGLYNYGVECLLHVSTFATTRVALPTGVEPG